MFEAGSQLNGVPGGCLVAPSSVPQKVGSEENSVSKQLILLILYL